ncbi:MAG: hypothetical protein QW471_04300 [Candidatus Woesearchaeota archaeon]
MKEQWGADLISEGFLDKFALMQDSNNNIFIISKGVSALNSVKHLRIDSAGLYFGELKNGNLRLSIEGSQIVGRHASKNIVKLSREECSEWMKGNSIRKDIPSHQGYLIVKYENYFLGCGRIKDGMLLNFIPKVRRVSEPW